MPLVVTTVTPAAKRARTRRNSFLSMPIRGDDRRARLLSRGDAGGFAAQSTEIVQLGAADLAAGDDLDLLQAGRVQREGALDADAVGDLADRERRAVGAVAV